MCNVVFALVRQVEIKQDSDGFAKFTANCHGCEVDVVAVPWGPFGVKLKDTVVAAIEVEEAHVKIRNHLRLLATSLLLCVPVSRKIILRLNWIRSPTIFAIFTLLVVMRMAELLEQANCTCPVAVVHLVDQHFAAYLCELVGVPN